MDLGPPIAYLALQKGTPVYSSDGARLGRVTNIIADLQEDVFDGIVIEEHPGRSGHRFVDADQIHEMHTDGVVLKLNRERAAELPEPSPNPPVVIADPTEPGHRSLSEKLKRAWDDISGNR